MVNLRLTFAIVVGDDLVFTVLCILVTEDMPRHLNFALISLHGTDNVHLLAEAQRVGIVIAEEVTPLLPALEFNVLVPKQGVSLLGCAGSPCLCSRTDPRAPGSFRLRLRIRRFPCLVYRRGWW